MNVLWIVIDSLRKDRLGCYGCERNTSPHLDRIARDCVRFDQMVSPHIPTHPAHTTLFSGRDVFGHQIVAQGGTRELDPAVRLIPDLLRQHGYLTAAVDNIGRWIEPAFEWYDPSPRWNHDGTLPWRNGEQVTERGLSFLNRAAGGERPFLLFLHYWDPHSPYLPPPPFDRMFYGGDEKDPAHSSMDPVWKSAWFANYFSEWLGGVRDAEFVKAQYDASVAYCDTCVSHVWKRMDELDLWDSTLVIVQSDHGEELDDHGCWFDHHGLYETNVSVPFLLRFPDGRGAGRRVPGLASLEDVAPTVLDVLGLAAGAVGMTGRSLLPLVAGEPGGSRAAVYLSECTWMRKRGWRTEEWKLIEALEPDIYHKPPLELYHLPTDPEEQNNLADTRPEVVRSLQRDRDAHITHRLQQSGGPDPIVEQADALRTWQPRFIAGRNG
jgi:arylsulfatase A-like enzyme